jgi:hypothetical protein
MSDKLVFDLSQELEGSPNVFIQKSWLSILDNQNGNYGSNQSVVDTSQLSNSNKFLSFRESFLSVPMLVTLTCDVSGFAPATAATAVDYAVGLKNWFGSIVHSFQVEYNNTTIVQQTPFINMWNSFKLMTSLSWNDVITQGSTIGFYPDDPLTFSYQATAAASGLGVCNNTNSVSSGGGLATVVNGAFNNYKSGNGNEGLLNRQTYVNYDPEGIPGSGSTFATLLTATNASNLWKSYISTKVNGATGVIGCFQMSIRATIYLKHLHSFFQNIPLLKGAYLKLTLNLNNSSVTFSAAGSSGALTLTSSTIPVGGVQPLMIASALANNGGDDGLVAGNYTASLSVGATCLNQAQRSIATVASGNVGNNVFLYTPAYAFNPIFEQAYLSNPLKTIEYTDVYQYNIERINAGGNINNLLTNGIASVKSVLCLPFYTSIIPTATSGVGLLPVWQSPYDPAGTGCTSPLCHLTNFNVVVSGQNAIYNTQRYIFEEFNNQLYGCNAVNGGLTDGLTSGLINSQAFEMEYCYHYVNVGRMLDVEQSVPKSVQIIGQNTSAFPITLVCFIEYGQSIQVDILTGAKV